MAIEEMNRPYGEIGLSSEKWNPHKRRYVIREKRIEIEEN